MDSYTALNENSYRIGKVTIDLSLHTQSADEAFFHYFGNDVLYSIKRTIHDDDIDSFTKAVCSAENSGTVKTVLRMKGCFGDYRYVLASISKNNILSKDGNIFIDISLHDILSLERLLYASEYKINEYRFTLSMCRDLAFEYSFETKRIRIYFFDSYRDIIITDEEIDVWKKFAAENRFIENNMIPILDDLCSDIKNGIYRFEYEFESSIFSLGRKKEYCLVKGVTHYDDIEHRKVLGTISVINPRTKAKDMNFAIEFNTDALTGLMNRSAAVHYAKRRIAAQPEHSINIVILNLDCFRNINNNYGHVFGDEVLYQTGKIIKTETGSRGIAGRIGSDEFMMVIEGTIDEIDLRGILRAVRTKIELSFAGRNIKITCSMGIASYPKDSLSYDELFAQANHALCIAKQKGGNRYVIYDSEKHGSPDGTISRNNPENSRLRFVSSICREIFTSVKPDMNDILFKIAEMFELDNIDIYSGSDMKCIYSLSGNQDRNADYFFSDNYADNFSCDGYFAIDNINMLEGRSQNAFLYFTEHNIMGAVQFICSDSNKPEILISYELAGHFKKWSDMDISYLTIIGRAVADSILQQSL